MMGEERRVGCILKCLRCYGMSGVRVSPDTAAMQTLRGVGGGRGWWSHQKDEARQQRKILGLKYVQNVGCPLPAPTPGSISTPLPGLGWSYINPTLVSPHQHSHSITAAPTAILLLRHWCRPGQWNFLATIKAFWSFCTNFLICVQSGIQCLGRMLPAESPVSVTASRITPIFMFRSRGRSDGGSGQFLCHLSPSCLGWSINIAITFVRRGQKQAN